MKENKLFSLLFLFLLIATSHPLEAQRTAFPSLEPHPKALELGKLAAEKNADWAALAKAALWASSVNAGPGAEGKVDSYFEKIAAAVAELTAADLPKDPKARGEYLLTYLHTHYLKKYVELQTRLDALLESGNYNCVSSAIFYYVLGRAIGLEVEGVMTRDHAFILLRAGTETIDVETTNPYGFDPGNRKEFHDAFGKVTGYAYTPAANYKERTAVTGVDMVSLILQNRIVAAGRAKRSAEEISLALHRAVFLSGASLTSSLYEEANSDLMGRIYNYGLGLLKAGREDDCLAWIENVKTRFSDSRYWDELIENAACNKLNKLVRAKKAPEARSAFTVLMPKLSNEKLLHELDTMILEAEILEKVSKILKPGDAEAVLIFLEKERDRLSPERFAEIQTAAILSEANRLAKIKDWAGNMRLLDEAIKKYGPNAKLEAVFKTMRQNRISELHNEFVVMFNKRDYNGAKASVQKSLEEFPGERQLVQDLNLVLKISQNVP